MQLTGATCATWACYLQFPSVEAESAVATESLEDEAASEADPSKQYSEEEAVLEPAEPLSSQIHREEEAHKAVAALALKPVNVENHKLTR